MCEHSADTNKGEAIEALVALRKIAAYSIKDEGTRIALLKIEGTPYDYISKK